MIDLTAEIPRAASAEWWDFLPQFIDTFNKKLVNLKTITVREYRKGMYNLDKSILFFKTQQKQGHNEEFLGDRTQEEVDKLLEDLIALRVKAMEFRKKYTIRGRVP